MDKPTFSVIMPVWNRSKRVLNAVHSVLAQTFQDFELLIVDDGSDDGLEEVVRPFLRPNVRYLHIPHSGVSAARNTGLREARGRLIAYLDSDNLWRTNFLERMREVLDEDPTGRLVAYALAEIHACNGKAFPGKRKVLGEPYSLRTMVRHNQIDQNTLVHARRCLDRVEGYDPSLKRLVDWDFLVRLTARYAPVFVPEVLVDYYWGLEDNAISLTEDPRIARKAVKRKVASDHALPKRIALAYDTVDYRWDDLPDETFDNWIRLRKIPHDLDAYRPNGHPFILQIEPSSCGHPSTHSPGEATTPGRHMTLPEFKGIVEDVHRWLMLAVLWGRGEAFANPQLPDIIRHASEAGIRTVTSAHAHNLNDLDYVAGILSSGLSTLVVVMDPVQGTEYHRSGAEDGHDKSLDGLKRMVELKRKLGSQTLINLRMVVTRQNEHDIKGMRRLARDLGVDRFIVKTLNPSRGAVFLDAELAPSSRRFQRFDYRGGHWDRVPVEAICDRVFTSASILSNGDVVPCCYHLQSSMKVGNVFETPFSRLWMSSAYGDLRRNVHEHRGGTPQCSHCLINYRLSRAGWFPEVSDWSADRRPFWDPRRYFQTRALHR